MKKIYLMLLLIVIVSSCKKEQESINKSVCTIEQDKMNNSKERFYSYADSVGVHPNSEVSWIPASYLGNSMWFVDSTQLTVSDGPYNSLETQFNELKLDYRADSIQYDYCINN